MGKTGRPRHPDILTPREWEVLALLRERLTNEEIASRLGISLDGAKYHVSQILSKLGVATREEAAVALAERRRGWAAWPLWARIAGAATLAAVTAGIAVLALGVLRTGTPTDAQREPVISSPAAVIPWADTPAPGVAEPVTIPGVSACQAADLGVRWLNQNPRGGPVDTFVWSIVLNNKASSPCFLGSTLQVRFVTADGHMVLPAKRTGGGIVYLEAPPPDWLANLTTPVPRFSREAGGSISLYSCHLPALTQLEITPGPGLGTLMLDSGAPDGLGTPCPSGAQSYRSHLSPGQCCSGIGSRTQTRIEAPERVRVGERFRFLITIINEPGATTRSGIGGPQETPTPPPLEWSPCPTYHQELQGVPGTFGTYRLNCESVAPLPSRGIATFEMYIDVPPDAQSGPSVLEWGLDGDEGMYQEASINVWIEPRQPVP
jgi:DNA-binding CsgD family transcriptional regulator